MRGRTSVLVAVAVFVAAMGCRKKQTSPPVVGGSALADTADQVMFGAKFNLTTAGVSAGYLTADTAFFLDDNTRIELSRVHMLFFTKTGAQTATLTARRGTYYAATSIMVGRGDVHVVSEDGRDLRSEELKFDQTHNEVSSDSAFVLTEPTRRLEGIGFRSDPNLKNIHVLKVLSGTSGSVTIPNQ